MENCLLACVLIGGICYIGAPHCQAAQTSFNHLYQSVQWSYQGNDVPETYWTPWLPIGAQQLTRYRIGFRFSTGTIAVKCPVKLTFTYDTTNAQSGKDLPVKVKAELLGAGYNTFESAFGLHLPNEFQVGFIGITGVPDFLPWYTLPWDLCGILGNIPGLPDALSNKVTVVCSAIENLGVNMNTKSALPLPGEAAYHDTRTLLDLKLTDFLSDSQKEQLTQDLGIKFYNGISSKLGSARMGKLLLVIRAAKNLDEAGATEFLTDKCISAAGKFTDLANITVIGDPYFKVEGVELNVLLRMYIPNGKGSGTYPLTFTSSGQEQTVTFRDITPFVKSGDKLVIVADEISYRFKLKQCLKPIVNISLFPSLPIDTYEKYVTLATARGQYNESEFKGEIPLVPSNEPIQSLRAQPGCTSAQINWTSPIVPLKGTIKVYQGNSLVKTVTENTFRPTHNNIITGLSKQTTYRFELSGATESGQTIDGGSVTTTTKENCSPREQKTTCNSLTFSTDPTASAGQTYLDFSWVTNERASTMVLVSPSPDLSANYIACVKKENGQVTQGWVTQGGLAELVTGHSIKVNNLDPGTKYYYNVVSWTYQDNNPTKDPINRIGYLSDITTSALPARPSRRVSVLHENRPVADATINVTKVGDSSYHASVVTPTNGMTQPLMLDAGKSYIFKVLNSGCYQDYTSPSLSVPANAQGELPPFTINLLAKPNVGAYVYDTAGRPIGGAGASFSGHTATTNASGYYAFGDVRPSGNVTVSISKAGYLTEQVVGKVEPCGCTRTFTLSNCVLRKNEGIIDIYVKKQDGASVPGAIVTVKKGSQILGATSTNSQGKVSMAVAFTSPQEQTLSVTATPPSSLSGADPAAETVKLAPEGRQSVYLNFIVAPPLDTQGPTVSNVSFSQPNGNTIGISFKSNEQVSTVSLEYKFPDGHIKNTPWYVYNSSLFLGNVASGYTTGISDTSLVGGEYKIRIKCKDPMGNLSETSQYDCTMFGDTSWGLKTSAVTADSITLSWNKFPYATDFAKYVLTPESGSAPFAAADITNINQTSHKLTGLLPNKTYKISLNAQAKAGWPLAAKAVLSVKTTAPIAPTINSFEPAPQKQSVNKSIKVRAQISDDDSQIKKVTLTAINKETKQQKQIATQDYNSRKIVYTKTFTIDEPGTYDLVLEVADESSKTIKTITYQVLPSGASEKEEQPEEAKKEAETKIEDRTAGTKEQPSQTKSKPGGDVSLVVGDIAEPVYARQRTTVTVTIKNHGESPLTGGRLMFYIDDKPYGSSKVVSLEPGKTADISRSFTLTNTGTSALKWEFAVPEDFIDPKPENNVVKRSVNVQLKPSTNTTSKTNTQTTAKIDIKKITIESEEKGAILLGQPLKVAVEVNATDDFAGSFAVNMELTKGKESQKFTQTVEKMKKGLNSFEWPVTKKLSEGGYYRLTIEISNTKLSLKDKFVKTFRVIEKKT